MMFLSAGAMIIVLASTLVGAVSLLIWGLRGKRIGDAPHCRNCGYNLTGLSSNRCPECASEITTESVVEGVRRKRRVPLAICMLLPVIAGGGLGLIGYAKAKSIDWYQFYTVSRLVRMGEQDDPRAIRELVRRAQGDELAASKYATLVSTSLAKQGATPRPPNIRQWATLLAVLDSSGGMSKEDRDLFYEQAATISLRARSPVRQGDPMVYKMFVNDRGTRLMPNVRWGVEKFLLDEKLKWTYSSPIWSELRLRGRSGSPRSFGGINIGWQIAQPGDHTIEIIGTVAVFAPDTNPDRSKPLWSREASAQVEFEVLPTEAPDPIKLIKDEALGEILPRVISIESLVQGVWDDGKIGPAECWLTLERPVWIALAFDVFAISEDARTLIGTCTWSEGTSAPAFLQSVFSGFDDEFQALPSQVEIELRTSRRAASETMDLYEIWDGVVELGRVAVER